MRRDVRVELRLTEAEAEEIRRRAARGQRSVSGYIRAKALGREDELLTELAQRYLRSGNIDRWIRSRAGSDDR